MRRRFSWLAMALLTSTACGGSSSTGPTKTTTNGAKSMSAKIDGAAWSATTVGGGVTGGIEILVGTNGTQSVSISFVPTVGTQTMTPTGIVIGQVTIGSQTWQASGSGASSGSVTVTTATATHVVGTFTFTAPVLGGSGSPATRQVTAGTFDVTF